MGNPKILAGFAGLCLLVAALSALQSMSAPSRSRSALELVVALSALGCGGFLAWRATQLARPRHGDGQTPGATRAAPALGPWMAAAIGGLVGATIGVVGGVALGWSPVGAVILSVLIGLVTGGMSLLAFWIARRRQSRGPDPRLPPPGRDRLSDS
jgi:hypothetical protein